MKILLTGATGYIGKRLLPLLVSEGHEVVCAVRDRDRFPCPGSLQARVQVVEVDFLDADTLSNIPEDIDGAYYLIHSMSTASDYPVLEQQCAQNFRDRISAIGVQHVIYLSGIVNEDSLSRHLASRKAVEETLGEGNYPFTTLRAGIIIGSGSASFEIVRDLVEKLPVMITPRWVLTKCQPIAIRDVLSFLTQTLFRKETYGHSYDISGPDVLTYKEMMLGFAKVRKLRRSILVVPVMTPRLSSYWLYFVTSTTYKLAQALVDSMKVEVVAKDNRLAELLGIEPMSYQDSLRRAFDKIAQNVIVSSWKDSFVSGRFNINISDFIHVPEYGCFKDHRERGVANRARTLDRVWAIGGDTGWYYANSLWRLRGLLDKLVGGVGLRRGRTHPQEIDVGDAVDFWRVIYANKEEGRLLLYAEMKLPGDAWLEFRVKDGVLYQNATFRPVGLMGRLYWYCVLPFHGIIFAGMVNRLAA